LAKSWLWLRSQQPKELQFSGSAANQTTMEISQFLRFEDATVRKKSDPSSSYLKNEEKENL
jgi:hypothetical protein